MNKVVRIWGLHAGKIHRLAVLPEPDALTVRRAIAVIQKEQGESWLVWAGSKKEVMRQLQQVDASHYQMLTGEDL